VVPSARDSVPAVNRLAAAVRHNGGGVFWVQMTGTNTSECRVAG
jgi:hypothetical protein